MVDLCVNTCPARYWILLGETDIRSSEPVNESDRVYVENTENSFENKCSI